MGGNSVSEEISQERREVIIMVQVRGDSDLDEDDSFEGDRSEQIGVVF